MKADAELFYNSISNLDREALLMLAMDQYTKLQELKYRNTENARIETEAHILHMELKDKYEKLLADYEAIAKDNARMHDRLALNNKAIFGSHTEKTISMLEHGNTDDVYEDESPVEDAQDNNDPSGRVINLQNYKDKKASDKSDKKDKESKCSI